MRKTTEHLNEGIHGKYSPFHLFRAFWKHLWSTVEDYWGNVGFRVQSDSILLSLSLFPNRVSDKQQLLRNDKRPELAKLSSSFCIRTKRNGKACELSQKYNTICFLQALTREHLLLSTPTPSSLRSPLSGHHFGRCNQPRGYVAQLRWSCLCVCRKPFIH